MNPSMALCLLFTTAPTSWSSTVLRHFGVDAVVGCSMSSSPNSSLDMAAPDCTLPKMPRTRREILEQTVQEYEADLLFYKTLFMQTSEVLYHVDSKRIDEVMNHMIRLLAAIDKLKDKKIPDAREVLKEYLEEAEARKLPRRD